MTYSSLSRRKDILAFLFLFLFLPLFFYNLGSYSLVDFDEAWFAEVARNILVTKNPLVLSFNNVLFLEHPPLGFNLMALSFVVFGTNDFAARFFSAFFGFGSLIVTYLIGKQFLNRIVGLAASLIFVSSVWFIFRVRTATLDTLFIFFYLLSFYAALRLKINLKWMFVLAISFALAFLSKMLIALTLIPALIYLLISQRALFSKQTIGAFIIFIALISPWVIANYLAFGNNFFSHIYYVGFRPFARIQPNWGDLLSSLTFQYLHFGIRKWYYPALISLVSGIFLVFKFKQLVPVYIVIITLLGGFLTNAKTEIWHLIPLYPFLAILMSFFLYQFSFGLLTLVKRILPKIPLGLIVSISVLTSIGSLAIYQIYLFRNEIRLFDRDISGLAFTAAQAKTSIEPLYLYADYFLPSAVFYSQKEVKMVTSEAYPQNTLPGFISHGPKPALLLTEKWKLTLDQVDPNSYETVSEYKEYVLLRI